MFMCALHLTFLSLLHHVYARLLLSLLCLNVDFLTARVSLRYPLDPTAS
jgi:hypothetical protein